MENITATPFTGGIPTLMNQTQLPSNITSADPTITLIGVTVQAFTFILFILLQVAFLGISAFISIATTRKAQGILKVSRDPDIAAGFAMGGLVLYIGLTIFYGYAIWSSWGDLGKFFAAFGLGGVLAICFCAVVAALLLGGVWGFVCARDMWKRRARKEVEDLVDFESSGKGDGDV